MNYICNFVIIVMATMCAKWRFPYKKISGKKGPPIKKIVESAFEHEFAIIVHL